MLLEKLLEKAVGERSRKYFQKRIQNLCSYDIIPILRKLYFLSFV